MKKSLLEKLESRVFLSTSPATVVGKVQWHGQSVDAVIGQYLAQTSGTDFAAFAARRHLQVSNVQNLGLDNIYSFESDAAPSVIASWSSKYSSIKHVEPNLVRKLSSTQPNDPRYAEQWQYNNTGQSAYSLFYQDSLGSLGYYTAQVGTPGADIDAARAWDIAHGNTETDPKKQVIVAVLDTGVDLTHPDLAANIFTNPGEIAGDGIDNDNNGYIDDVQGWNSASNNNDASNTATISSEESDFAHGTHVAGIIAGVGNNGVGVSGTAWDIKILPIRIAAPDGTLTETGIIGGLQYVRTLKLQGFNIVAANGSFGGPRFPFSAFESQAYQQLGNAGVLFVAAAGNDSLNLDANLDFPAKYSLNLPTVITVAATDNQDHLATFSNYGAASVDVAAPGVSILSTWARNVVAPRPFESIPGVVDPFPTQEFVANQSYASIDGTSMAAPVVAGILALEKLANPQATPAQLKQALLDGVDVIPALGASNGAPARVRTGGRVNAFKAVQAIRNLSLGSDTAHRGTWHGAYGADGAYIVGESTSFPSFVTGTITGNSTQVQLDDSSTRPEALQRAGNPDDRIVAYLATPTELGLDLNFNDGNTHRVGLYFADYEKKNRKQTVSVVDSDSGEFLQTQTIKNFAKGEYLFWDLRGHVQIQIGKVRGATAVLSGVFFDPSNTDSSLFKGTDSTTHGAWNLNYGSQGAIVTGDTAASTSFANIVNPGNNAVIDTIRDNIGVGGAALTKVENPYRAIQSFYTSASDASSFDLDLNITDGKSHLTTFYFADYGNRGRIEKIEIFDSTGTTLLNRQDVTGFAKGKYITFELAESVKVRVTDTSTRANTNPVLSGVFFDAVDGQNAAFLGTNTKMRGNWRRAQIGNSAAFIAGVSGTFADFNQDQVVATFTDLSFVPTHTEVYRKKSTNPIALQYPTGDTAQRIAANLVSPVEILVDIQFTDARQHKLSAYFVDYLKQATQQRVQIVDPDTGAALTTQTLTKATAGKYLTWTVQGHVQLRISTLNVSPAILTGLFVD